jgi:PST family polysaccharide transporter
MTFTQILLSLSAQLDSLLIGKFAGATQLGLYRQADTLMKAPIDRLNAPIASVSQSALSILQLEPARYSRYYQRILSAVSLVTVPLGVFTALFAEEIVLVALGEKWAGTTIYLRIFALLACIRPALSTFAIVMVTCGRSARFFMVSVVHSALLIGLMVAGIRFGAVGVATAHLLTAILLTPWLLRYALEQTPVSASLFWRSIAKPAIASVAMAAVASAVHELRPADAPVVALAVGCATAVPSYFVALCALPGGRKELKTFVSELTSALRTPTSTARTSKQEIQS